MVTIARTPSPVPTSSVNSNSRSTVQALLHPVQDLATLRLVLLIRDEALIVHRLQFAHLVRGTYARTPRSEGRSLAIVTPDTILRWQRRRSREHWTKLSGRPTRGRPPVNPEIAALVTRMTAANPLWGAPRIHGELLKLGFHVAERTVSRLIPKRRTPPSQTWRTFLTNHVPDLVSLDFFTVPTARLRVLFVFVVLAHDRRRVLNFNVTEHPSAAWTAQQIVDAFPDDSAPSYLLRDRDSIYGHAFRQRVKGMGISEVLTAPLSPCKIRSPSGSSARSDASV